MLRRWQPFRSLVLVGLLSCAAFAGCLSPTLPLPPPGEPDGIGANEDGTWQIAGTCIEGAEVVVLNEATGRGAVVVDLDRNGRYVAVIEGDACDVILVSQSIGDEASGEARAVLQEVENGAEVDPDACR